VKDAWDNTGGQWWERARRSLAGGVDSPVRAGVPVGESTPLLVKGRGSRVWDVVGREYIDYLCAYGPVLLGHADPRVTEAVARAMSDGPVFGATHPEEVRLAERLRGLFPSMELVRLVSTGTEACMGVIRVARGYTRRERIVRCEGCYHGHSDAMIFAAGASSLSEAAISCGVTRGVAAEVDVVPFNDLPALELVLRERGRETAAVILEPVVGNMGLCLPEAGYLAGVRELCRKHGVLLIFDEVITGLRAGPGGAQAIVGVTPDLTCLGKALGGGLPLAAFGGRKDVMSVLAPEGPVFAGGTFSGNPVCVAAAHAVLDAIAATADFYPRLEATARRLAQGLADVLARRGLPYPVVQFSSMVDFMFRPGPPHRTMREARQADAHAYAAYYHAMLNHGVLLPPSQMELMFVTAAHTDEDVDATLRAADEALGHAAR
jgi:glutamate-1-semialdehyde 2,1-aminomutase